MINRLKRKFLIAATVFMFILMTVLVLIMNIVNYHEVASDADSVLDVLAMPNLPFLNGQTPPSTSSNHICSQRREMKTRSR